jgi:hypothetical protein
VLWIKLLATRMNFHLAHQINWRGQYSHFLEVNQKRRSRYSSGFNLDYYFDQNWINLDLNFAWLEQMRNQKLHLERLILEVHSLIFKVLNVTLLVYMLNYYFRHAFYVIIFSRHLVLYFLSFWRSHLLKVPFHHCYLELQKPVQLFKPITSLESSTSLNLAIQTFHSLL